MIAPGRQTPHGGSGRGRCTLLVLRVVGLSLALLTMAAAGGVSAQEAGDPPHGDASADRHAHRGHDRVHGFQDAEAWAGRFNDPERDAWQRPAEVVDLLGPEAGMTVADLGAGTGYFTPHLAHAVGSEGRVLALDVSEEMIRYLRQTRLPELGLDNVEARRVGPDDPGLETGSVDRVLVVNTWHHISARRSYAAALARSLTPGGRVVIVDFTLESEMGPPPAMRLKPEAVVEELEAGGFEARVVDEGLPKQYVVVGEVPTSRGAGG